MADPVDPTSIDPTQLDALGTQASRVSDIMSGFLGTLKNTYETLSKVFGRESLSNITNFAGEIGQVSDVFDKLKENIDVLGQINTDTVKLTTETGELSSGLDKVIDKFFGLSQFISNAKMFDQFSTESAAAINTIDNSVAGLHQSLKSLGVDVNTDKLQVLFDNAAQSEKLEGTYIALAASTGRLDEAFTGEVITLKDLSAVTSEYINMVGKSADATGFSIKQTEGFAASLGKVPGVMDSNVNSFSEVTGTTNGLTEAMKLMSGSGKSMEEVAGALNTAYEDLSQSQGKVAEGAQRGSEFFATISQTANILKLRFGDVKDVLGGVASQFKFVGDNTDAAARVLGRYTDALRETGLTSKASTEIIQGMIKSVSDLSIGAKAFASARTGGPGGLQGAFKIDQMLREGKLDEVVQMMEKNIKQQFGGRIYTQAEAAQSPEAASQFMRQRSLLQSGAFGLGKGTNDDQATRLLEALKNGNVGSVRAITTGQDALREVTDRGTAIQEHNFNELKRLNNSSERIAVAAELQAGATVRNLFGTGGANASNLTQAARLSSAEGERVNAQRATGAKTDLVSNLLQLGKDAIAQGTGAAKGIGAGVGEGIGMAAKAGGDLVSDMNEFVQSRTKTPTVAPVVRGSRPNVGRDMLTRDMRSTTPIVNTPMARPVVATAGKQSQTTAQQAQDVKLHIDITAPDGFDVVATSNDQNIHPDINRKSMNNAGSWPAKR